MTGVVIHLCNTCILIVGINYPFIYKSIYLTNFEAFGSVHV